MRKQFLAGLLNLCYFVRTDSEIIETENIHFKPSVYSYFLSSNPKKWKSPRSVSAYQFFLYKLQEKNGYAGITAAVAHASAFFQTALHMPSVVFKHFFLRTWEEIV